MIAAEVPAQDIKAQKGEKYLPFKTAQLQAIFNLPVYRGCLNEKRGRFKPGKRIIRDTFFWIPLIALYTGARLNEICQMTTDDIITKEGVDCFSINDNAGKRVKTFAGIRIVPIHPALKKMGFLKYVEQRRLDKHNKAQALFPQFNDNKRDGLSGYFSKWFIPRKLQSVVKRKEIRYSLHTNNYFEALKKLRQESAKIDSWLEGLM